MEALVLAALLPIVLLRSARWIYLRVHLSRSRQRAALPHDQHEAASVTHPSIHHEESFVPVHPRPHVPSSSSPAKEGPTARRFVFNWARRKGHDSPPVKVYTRYWQNKDTSRNVACMLMLHGLHSFCGNFAKFVRHWTDRGIVVYTLDFEGHGRSEGLHGCFYDVDALVHSVDAVLHHYRELHVPHARLPWFLFGGSMGGNIALQYALKYGHHTVTVPSGDGKHPLRHKPIIDGLVLLCPLVQVAKESRPGTLTTLIGEALNFLFPELPLLQGARGRSFVNPADELMFSQHPMAYSGRLRVCTAFQLRKAIETVENNMHKINLPFIVQHGTRDLVVDISGSRQLFKRSSSTDKTLKEYEGCYHSLFYESQTEQIINDHIEWMLQRCPSA